MRKLVEVCKELKLGNLEEIAGQVEYQNNQQYLADILELVLRKREARRIQRLIKQAKFPAAKTFENYCFDSITFPNGFNKEQLLSLEFIKRKENLLCIGAVGNGKSHLAAAIGLKACTEGKKVKFYRAANLSTELAEKHQKGNLRKYLQGLEKLDLLILDEVGFIPFDKTSSQLLFNVISNSYEHQSVIITSNLEFGKWNEIFGDDRLTAALIDRLIHHAHILGFTGKSYRYHAAMLAKGGVLTEDK